MSQGPRRNLKSCDGESGGPVDSNKSVIYSSSKGSERECKGSHFFRITQANGGDFVHFLCNDLNISEKKNHHP